MTMLDILRRAEKQKEYEWHRQNAASLLRVRHFFPVAKKIREHLAHARYYKFLLAMM